MPEILLMDLGIHRKESVTLHSIINNSFPLYMFLFIDFITISIHALQFPLISMTV